MALGGADFPKKSERIFKPSEHPLSQGAKLSNLPVVGGKIGCRDEKNALEWPVSVKCSSSKEMPREQCFLTYNFLGRLKILTYLGV